MSGGLKNLADHRLACGADFLIGRHCFVMPTFHLAPRLTSGFELRGTMGAPTIVAQLPEFDRFSAVPARTSDAPYQRPCQAYVARVILSFERKQP
jgi:hypothetical protein